jgi:hypothetical protein
MAVLMWMLEVPSTDERSKLTRAPHGRAMQSGYECQHTNFFCRLIPCSAVAYMRLCWNAASSTYKAARD